MVKSRTSVPPGSVLFLAPKCIKIAIFSNNTTTTARGRNADLGLARSSVGRALSVLCLGFDLEPTALRRDLRTPTFPRERIYATYVCTRFSWHVRPTASPHTRIAGPQPEVTDNRRRLYNLQPTSVVGYVTDNRNFLYKMAIFSRLYQSYGSYNGHNIANQAAMVQQPLPLGAVSLKTHRENSNKQNRKP